MPEQARTASAGRGAYRAMALAPSTRRLYDWLWAAWERYCAVNNLTPFPATPDEVAVYIERRADAGDRFSTLENRAGAIGARHRDEGLPSPCRDHEFQLLFKGIARAQAGSTPAQASGLTNEVIERIEAALNLKNPKHQATVALCRVMRDAMLRRTEATEIRWDDITEGGAGAGELLIRHSKTDQTGRGYVVFLSAPTMTALARIRPVDATGKVFPVHPLTIARRIQAAARKANLPGRFRGHSPRVGMTQDLAAAGASVVELQQVGRWKLPRMPAYYARYQSAHRGAVAKFYRNLEKGEPAC